MVLRQTWGQVMEKERKSLVGRVIGDKMDKTVVVVVESLRPHPLYRKVIRRRTKVKAHDGENACREGDVVAIEESHPLSKTKHWRVARVVSKAEVVESIKDDTASE